jgi:hypothetical protein
MSFTEVAIEANGKIARFRDDDGAWVYSLFAAPPGANYMAHVIERKVIDLVRPETTFLDVDPLLGHRELSQRSQKIEHSSVRIGWDGQGVPIGEGEAQWYGWLLDMAEEHGWIRPQPTEAKKGKRSRSKKKG